MNAHTHFWIDPLELKALPTTGVAWEAMQRDALLFTPGSIDLSNQDSKADTQLMALVLRSVRTTDKAGIARVKDGLSQLAGTEAGGRTLALGRNMVGPCIAADLIGFEDQKFASWVRNAMRETLDGKTLISTHEERPNNWGTHAGAARMAADAYLFKHGAPGQREEAERDAMRALEVFQGWLGDRKIYAGFQYGALDWQSDPQHPVGINPPGAMIQGHSVDGVLPDDQRRSGKFVWPPPKENYVWEALQGAVVQAHIASRFGFGAWAWSSKAILRALFWLHDVCKFPATGDDLGTVWLANYHLGTSFPTKSPTTAAKNVTALDWTFAGRA